MAMIGPDRVWDEQLGHEYPSTPTFTGRGLRNKLPYLISGKRDVLEEGHDLGGATAHHRED